MSPIRNGEATSSRSFRESRAGISRQGGRKRNAGGRGGERPAVKSDRSRIAIPFVADDEHSLSKNRHTFSLLARLRQRSSAHNLPVGSDHYERFLLRRDDDVIPRRWIDRHVGRVQTLPAVGTHQLRERNR